MDERSNNVPEKYQVNVVVLEGRHLPLTNSTAKVKISIGKKKKTIHARTNKTDSPYFNEFCVFHFFLPLSILLNEIMTVKVYEVSRIKRKLIGSFSVELATIWYQPNHEFHHKWAVLTNLKKPNQGIKGFLKCDIVILGKNMTHKREEEESEDEKTLENNLLVPKGDIKDRIKTKMTFSVFRADSFSSYYTNSFKETIPEPYVKITCGGTVKKTNIATNKGPPVWNQELVFFDLYPPLFQSILVEICDRRKPSGKVSLGNTSLNVNNLYVGQENGFLPTFGPNFIYLYRPLKKFHRHPNCCTFQDSFTYMCRLLLAIRTETLDTPVKVKVRKKKKKDLLTISPLIESEYFEYKKFILFTAIFDVLFFDSKYFTENLSIRINIGPKKNIEEVEKSENEIRKDVLKNPKQLMIKNDCNATKKMKCEVKGDHSFITFPGKYPCIHVIGEWPDSLRQMYCANVVKNAIQNCKNEVDKIINELQFEKENTLEVTKKIKQALGNLSKSCEIILLNTNVKNTQDTNLRRERRRVYHSEIAKIAEKTRISSKKTALIPDNELKALSSYLKTITKYGVDPENSFPDTELWLLKNSRITDQYRIRTEDIVYSPNILQRGIMSGKTQTLIIRSKKQKIKAKIDVYVWFGLADDFMQCLNMLPSGFQHDHLSCPSSTELKIPTEIIYKETHNFQCRAHILQGKIMSAYDDTGLADPYVQVIIMGQNQKTQVRKATLSPIWDETLLFPKVTLHGSATYIRENAITITVEVFDKNRVNKSELIGRSFVKPVIKLAHHKYELPKLKWEIIESEFNVAGEILMVTELLELSNSATDLYSKPSTSPLSIPENIKPHYIKYRLEVLFWGVRQLRKKKLKNKLFVTLEFGETVVKSPILKNSRNKLNFPVSSIRYIELDLPEEPEYFPPFSLKLYHINSISHKEKYVGNCIVPSVRLFAFNLTDNAQRQSQKEISIQIAEEIERKNREERKKRYRRLISKIKTPHEVTEKLHTSCVLCCKYLMCKIFKKCKNTAFEEKPIPDDEPLNWWIKYYASTEKSSAFVGIPTFTVYKKELELQPEFKGFMEFLHTFNMVKGRGKKFKTIVPVAKLKAALRLYKWEKDGSDNKKTLNNLDPNEGLLSKEPTNEAVNLVVRVYIVCGKNLAPRDINGKTDPYLHVELGQKSISDRKNYHPKQLNPTFGKCFEFKAALPWDSLLRIKVLDFDTTRKDDLIGETTIDIENRYYSKYHATCGLAKTFEKDGWNAWRDIYLPTAILKNTCKESSVKEITYKTDRVVVEGHEIKTDIPEGAKHRQQIQALIVLNKWHEIPLVGFHLVPEHIETRTLYHPSRPGIEQGKLEMWVDIFPADFRYMPPKVDIKPGPAVPMELRAIVWNVDDVILDDKSFFSNEKMSDIYVRGWILSLEEELQKTDVHYRSLNGEGSFNWRFIFHFNYVPAERKMTVKKKMSAFDFNPEERKNDCKLEIQVWDNDAFGDDYLGTLILELCAMPRGAKLSNRCTLKMLAPNAAKINLFKIRKTRGWWPFRRLKERQTLGNEFELSGKIDLELEILTEAEAKQVPAGKGRDDPLGLPPPVRPSTSFNWMLSPLKTFRYIIWRKIVRYLISTIFILIVVFFVLVSLYAFPNYVVKRLVGA